MPRPKQPFKKTAKKTVKRKHKRQDSRRKYGNATHRHKGKKGR